MVNKLEGEELLDAFAEGVRYTTEEGWVSPDAIADPELSAQYKTICDLWRQYWKLTSAFDHAIYEKYGADD